MEINSETRPNKKCEPASRTEHQTKPWQTNFGDILSLCWSCRNATGVEFKTSKTSSEKIRCPWVHECRPVPNWVVQNVQKGALGYSVLECPLYRPDLETEIRMLPKKEIAPYFNLPKSLSIIYPRAFRKLLYLSVQNAQLYLAYAQSREALVTNIAKMTPSECHKKLTKFATKLTGKIKIKFTPPRLPTAEVFRETMGEVLDKIILIALQEAIYFTEIDEAIEKEYNATEGAVSADDFIDDQDQDQDEEGGDPTKKRERDCLLDIYKKLFVYVVGKQKKKAQRKYRRVKKD